MPHLPHLINFSLISFLLQVDQLSYALLPEDVVASANTLLESQPQEQPAKVHEVDVSIGLRPQDALKKFLILIHAR